LRRPERLRRSVAKRVPRLRRMNRAQGCALTPPTPAYAGIIGKTGRPDAHRRTGQTHCNKQQRGNTALSPVHRTSEARIGNPLRIACAKRLARENPRALSPVHVRVANGDPLPTREAKPLSALKTQTPAREKTPRALLLLPAIHPSKHWPDRHHPADACDNEIHHA